MQGRVGRCQCSGSGSNYPAWLSLSVLCSRRRRSWHITIVCNTGVFCLFCFSYSFMDNNTALCSSWLPNNDTLTELTAKVSYCQGRRKFWGRFLYHTDHCHTVIIRDQNLLDKLLMIHLPSLGPLIFMLNYVFYKSHPWVV